MNSADNSLLGQTVPGGSQPTAIDVVDVHVGGDLHRIVLGGIKPLPGSTILEQMKYLKAEGDGLRQILLNEPRGGHPSLFADLVVPSAHPEADAGFIIMEIMGYPLISGTNTMIGCAVQSGRSLDHVDRTSLRCSGFDRTTARIAAPAPACGAVIEND